MKCPYCNSEIKDDLPFCPKCKKPLLVDANKEKIASSDLFFENLPFYHSNVDEEGTREELDTYQFEDAQDNKLDEEIIEIDKKIDIKAKKNESVGELLLEKASLYYKKRDLRTASKILEIALSNFQNKNNINNMKYTAICYNELGIIKEDLGFFEEAIYNFENSVSILQEIEDQKGIIQVYNNLGNVYYQIKDIEKSYTFYQKAIDLSEKLGLIYDEVKSSSNLVEILFVLEDYDRVKRILNRNSEFFIQNGDAYGSITTLIKYGKLYYFLGDSYYQKSQTCFFDALELINTIEEQIPVQTKAKLEWEIYFYLGKQILHDGNLINAEDYLLKSLDAIRTFEFGDFHIKEGVILEALGTLYEHKRDPTKAINYYNLATEVYQKFGEDVKISEIFKKIGHLHLEDLNDHLEAVFFLEKALTIYENHEYLKEAAEILNQIGDIYVNKNMNALAINRFREAKAIYKDLNDLYHSEIITQKIKTLNNSDT
ncbi:MAG: tetratricopeptide repeat protein [Promethearchaeota archaeon]|nr:MAG: tetratricopeptide repeat protein [Candidatus Lokiarchaeota archaeon]